MIVDGNDVLAVRDVTAEAVARARAGDGPTLIEAKSYRITPHSAATKTDLRPPEELDAWRARDPILSFSRYLGTEAGVAAARLEQIEERGTRQTSRPRSSSRSPRRAPSRSRRSRTSTRPPSGRPPGRLS